MQAGDAAVERPVDVEADAVVLDECMDRPLPLRQARAHVGRSGVLANVRDELLHAPRNVDFGAT
jgi:hypothetical protein